MQVRIFKILVIILCLIALSTCLHPFSSEVKAGTGDAPSNFKTINLVISPKQVAIGESVTVRITVVNTGDVTGSYRLTLKVNNVNEESKEVELATGESQDVTFLVSRDVAGEYSVVIDTLSGSFIVSEQASKPPSAAIVVIISVAIIFIILLGLWLVRRRLRGK